MSPLYLEAISLETALPNNERPQDQHLMTERRRDERAFYMLFMLTFPLFLMAALVGRLARGGVSGGRNSGMSVVAEASTTARSTIAIALTN